MGWDPAALGGKEFLILSTHGGIRAADGTPVALGYHTGHWEVGLLMDAAAKELKSLGAIPFAAYCTDPCDGRTQGTTGMFDSLPYRNDAASVFKRLIRSLPTRSGVLGIATCDKGLPAMMMALAGTRNLPCVLIPGGVTLLAEEGEDAGKVQSVGARFAHSLITVEAAALDLCRACATPGGGCQFLGTAATAQVVGEALGMSLTHSALEPVRPPCLDGYGPPFRPRRPLSGSTRAYHEGHPHAGVGTQCDGGARGVRRIDQPDSAPARHRLVGRIAAPHGGRLDARQPANPAPGGCASQRAEDASHGPGLHGGRRAGSDAASAPRRIAGHQRPHRQRRNSRRHARLVGTVGTPHARCEACFSIAMEWTPTM